MPLELGERQTVGALLAALIVHSANDAAVVLAHVTMQQPAAQAAAAQAARELGRPLPGDPVARFVLLMNAEARRLGLNDTVYRTPHGLDEPGAHSSARDVLKLAQIDMRSPLFRALAGRRAIAIPGHRLETSNTLLAVYAGLDGVKTGHTDEAGWNLAASADRNGMRIYAILLGAPDEAHRDRDVARLLDWGFDQLPAGPPGAPRAALRQRGRRRGGRGARALRRARPGRAGAPAGGAAAAPRRARPARRAPRLRRAAQRARRARPRTARRRPRGRRTSGARVLAALASGCPDAMTGAAAIRGRVRERPSPLAPCS